MTTIILGQHPGRLDVRLVEGDAADLVATLVDQAGAAIDWPAAPTLEFATSTAPIEHEAAIDGTTASWSLTDDHVAELAALPRPLLVRVTAPDDADADGRVEYAGRVSWSDGWTAGDRTQRVTFTLPGGPPGPPGPPGPAGAEEAPIDHGAVADALAVEGGTHTLDLNGDLAITTTGDATFSVYGIGTVAVAGESFEVAEHTVIVVFDDGRSQYAYRAGGEASATPVDPPASAPLATLGTVTSDSATINWSPVAGATGYQIRLDGGAPATIGNVATYTRSGLPATTAGAFEVRATNAGGPGPWSVPVEFTTTGDSITDSFAAADGTTLDGRTPSNSLEPWTAPALLGYVNAPPILSIVGNRAGIIIAAPGDQVTRAARVPITESGGIYSVSVDYITAGKGQVRLAIGNDTDPGFWAYLAEGSLTLFKPDFNSVAGAIPASGHLALVLTPTEVRAEVNGDIVATLSRGGAIAGTVYGGMVARLDINETGTATLDNFSSPAA